MLAPVLIAGLMAVGGTLVAFRDSPDQPFWPSWQTRFLMVVGGVLTLYVFMEDALRTVSQGADKLMTLRPTHFDWPLFLAALVCLSASVVELAWRARSAAGPRHLRQRGGDGD